MLPFIMLATVFLLIPPSFCGKLRVVRARRSCQNCRLWALDFRFFWPRVFCRLKLRISLGRNGVHWSVALVAVLIGIVADESLYLGLGLSPSSFLNQGALPV